MDPSSGSSRRLSSSWCRREPENCQKIHPTLQKKDFFFLKVQHRLTISRRLLLNVMYSHMGFPSRRTGTAHSASTTRTFCTTSYTWRVTRPAVNILSNIWWWVQRSRTVLVFLKNVLQIACHGWGLFLFRPSRCSLVSVHVNTVLKLPCRDLKLVFPYIFVILKNEQQLLYHCLWKQLKHWSFLQS